MLPLRNGVGGGDRKISAINRPPPQSSPRPVVGIEMLMRGKRVGLVERGGAVVSGEKWIEWWRRGWSVVDGGLIGWGATVLRNYTSAHTRARTHWSWQWQYSDSIRHFIFNFHSDLAFLSLALTMKIKQRTVSILIWLFDVRHILCRWFRSALCCSEFLLYSVCMRCSWGKVRFPACVGGQNRCPPPSNMPLSIMVHSDPVLLLFLNGMCSQWENMHDLRQTSIFAVCLCCSPYFML